MLAEAGTAVNKKRIVRGAAGILGDGHAGGAAEAVTVTFDEVVEGVVGIEVGVDGDALDAGDDVGVLDLLYFFLGQGYVGIADSGCRLGCRISYCSVLDHRHLIHQFRIRSDHSFEGLAEYVDEVGLNEFREIA